MNKWLEMQDLNEQDCNELLNAIREHLITMELKNQWDARVNEMKFQSFLEQAFWYMEEYLDNLLDGNLEKYEWYPKIQQFYEYLELVYTVDCTIQEAEQDFGITVIYEMVERWWATTFGC